MNEWSQTKWRFVHFGQILKIESLVSDLHHQILITVLSLMISDKSTSCHWNEILFYLEIQQEGPVYCVISCCHSESHTNLMRLSICVSRHVNLHVLKLVLNSWQIFLWWNYLSRREWMHFTCLAAATTVQVEGIEEELGNWASRVSSISRKYDFLNRKSKKQQINVSRKCRTKHLSSKIHQRSRQNQISIWQSEEEMLSLLCLSFSLQRSWSEWACSCLRYVICISCSAYSVYPVSTQPGRMMRHLVGDF